MRWALFTALAYILGSVPFGVIVAKCYKVDLRTAGSGNIGATNAMRVIGRKAGLLTLAGDLLKGAIAVYLALRFAGRDAGYMAAGAAVLGHDFPVFLWFKGGKGVATGFGVLLVLEPYIALIGLLVWITAVLMWRYSSLGALVSFGLLPAWALILKGDDRSFLMLSIALTALVFIKHRSNIVRLAHGQEGKVGRS